MKFSHVIGILFIGILLIGLAILPPSYAASAHGKKGKQAPAKKSPVSPSIWQPDPSMANDLGPATLMGNYTMQVPLGYKNVPIPTTDDVRAKGFDNYLFGHDSMPDGSKPIIGVSIATPPPNIPGTMPISDALASVIDQKRQSWENFTISPVEHGQIGTLTFMRAYYKGTLTGNIGTRTVHGFVYATVDGRTIITIQTEAAEPYSKTLLPVAEAGILSFHKQ